MPNILDKITNTLNEYVADAKNIKGTYVVVNDYSELASLPVATVVEGTLAYCVNDYYNPLVPEEISNKLGFYQYDGSNWNIIHLGPIKIVLDKYDSSNFDITETYTWTGVDLYSILTDLLGITQNGGLIQIDFNDLSILFNYQGIADANDSVCSIILIYNNQQYIATLTSSSTGLTLSFQELQAGSGGGTGSGGLYKHTLHFGTAGEEGQAHISFIDNVPTSYTPETFFQLANDIADDTRFIIPMIAGWGSTALTTTQVFNFSVAGVLISQNEQAIRISGYPLVTLNSSSLDSVIYNDFTESDIATNFSDVVEPIITGGGSSGEGTQPTEEFRRFKLHTSEIKVWTDPQEVGEDITETLHQHYTFIIPKKYDEQLLGYANELLQESFTSIDELFTYLNTAITSSGSDAALMVIMYKQMITTLSKLTPFKIELNYDYKDSYELPVEEYFNNALTIQLDTMTLKAYAEFNPSTGVANAIEFLPDKIYQVEYEDYNFGGSSSGGSSTSGSGKLYELNMELTRYDENGDEVPFTNDNLGVNYYDDGNTTLKLTLCFYDSNWEKIKTKLNALIDLVNQQLNVNVPHLTDVNSLVSFINASLDETVADLDVLGFVLLNEIIPLCDNAYYSDWSYPLENIYNIINVNLVSWSIGIYDSGNLCGVKVMFFDSVNSQDKYYALNVHNSCTLTEYGTSGSGGGGSVQTKKWYKWVLTEAGGTQEQTLVAWCSESKMSDIIDVVNQNMSTNISTTQELIALYNSLRNEDFSQTSQLQDIFGLLMSMFCEVVSDSMLNSKQAYFLEGADGVICYPTATTNNEYMGLVPICITDNFNWFNIDNATQNQIRFSTSSTLTITEETETIGGGGSVTPQPSQNNLCYLRIRDSGDAANVIFLLDRNFFDSQAVVTTLNAGITQINTLFSISIPSYVTVDSVSDIATYLRPLPDATYAAAKVVFYASLFEILSYYSISSKLFRFDNASIYPMVCQATADDQIQTYTYSIQYLDPTSSPLAFTTVWDNTQTFDFHIDIDTDNLV